MVLRHVWLVPVAAVSCSLIAMLSGYIIGVLKNHFPAILPFISDGGAFQPEASLFAEFFNMASFFMVIMFYMRHRQTVEYYGHRLNWEQTKWRKVSLALMWIGIISAVGITVVANFRVNEVPKVHGLGALLTFFALLVYAWGQVILSYALIPRMASMPVNHFRLFVVTLATLLLILNLLAVFLQPFVPKSAGPPPEGWVNLKWLPKDSPYYANYLVSTSSEWAMTLMSQIFFLSFVAELRFSYAHAPRVIFNKTTDYSEGFSEQHSVRVRPILSSFNQVVSDG